MIKPFKLFKGYVYSDEYSVIQDFLIGIDVTDINNNISVEVMDFFNGFNESRNYEITTTIATYKLSETVYGGGEVVSAKVVAYPLLIPTVKIIYTINYWEIISISCERQ